MLHWWLLSLLIFDHLAVLFHVAFGDYLRFSAILVSTIDKSVPVGVYNLVTFDVDQAGRVLVRASKDDWLFAASSRSQAAAHRSVHVPWRRLLRAV